MFITDLAYLEDASQEIVADVKGGQDINVGVFGLANLFAGNTSIIANIEDVEAIVFGFNQ
ncbi:hypothetical protein VB711_20060 [Cronbergia sp. UHCC 0137]|uniref:hypothetical protein n=1 Tax=Cronbergia sp. UHCC 0137 TaxID=3110239 RepID=UPI002B20DCC9|nr:hypothetical protein [Cronbergia sp. UHCC 0137]MEA5620121.1 hypothetical protein [Cronbergia sp. UHCC 0137]